MQLPCQRADWCNLSLSANPSPTKARTDQEKGSNTSTLENNIFTRRRELLPLASEATSHLRLAVPTKDVCGCVQCLAGENGYTGLYQHNGQKSSGPAVWHYLQSIIARSFESQMAWSQMTSRLQQRRDSEGCMQTFAKRQNAVPHCGFAMGESAPGNLKIPV